MLYYLYLNLNPCGDIFFGKNMNREKMEVATNTAPEAPKQEHTLMCRGYTSAEFDDKVRYFLTHFTEREMDIMIRMNDLDPVKVEDPFATQKNGNLVTITRVRR